MAKIHKNPMPSSARAGGTQVARDAASSAKGSAPGSAAEPAARSGALGALMGWIVIPSVVFGMIFAVGVHLGAQHPDAWYSRVALWGAKAVGITVAPPAQVD